MHNEKVHFQKVEYLVKAVKKCFLKKLSVWLALIKVAIWGINYQKGHWRVGRGFRTIKPDPSGLVISFAFQNLWNPTWTDNFNVFDEILSIPDQIQRDFVEIRWDLAVIWWNLGHISTDLAKYLPRWWNQDRPDTTRN